jgi:hypothetical protein
MNLDPKQKKYLIIGGVILLSIYAINKWLKSLPKALPADLQSSKLDKTKVLMKGSKGAEVVELQRLLVKDYNADLGDSGINKDGIDGDFGTMTESALVKAKGVNEITLNEI